MTSTYLIVTIKVRDQITSDRAPSRSSYDGDEEKVEEYTYGAVSVLNGTQEYMNEVT
jgi:hypothetical protein